MLKNDPRIAELLDAVPDKPPERSTKEELQDWIDREHDRLTTIRKVLLNLAANSLLIIGEGSSEKV